MLDSSEVKAGGPLSKIPVPKYEFSNKNHPELFLDKIFVLPYNHLKSRAYPGRYIKMSSNAKYILGLSVLLLISCATFVEQKQAELFEITSTAYKQALFFGKHEEVNGFIKEPASEKQNINTKGFKKIKVTSYEPLTTKGSKDKTLVNQTVEIKYYSLDSMIEKTIVDNQLWKYYLEEKAWYLESGFPDFKY